jgi:hypothetical protein
MLDVDSFPEMFGVNDYNNNNIADNVDDNIRTIDSGYDTFSVTEKNAKICLEDSGTENDVNINIFRYKFTDDFTNELFKFSKIHQYDHRKDFKEAWKIWLEENEIIVEEEIRRLTNLGYDGDVVEKMFKSARYYFRKKSTEKKAPSKRREYVGVNKALLDAMDKHIRMGITIEDFKPSDGFDEFCIKNKELLREEVNNLCKNGFTDSNEIKNKIKKTYKNRYFLLINK